MFAWSEKVTYFSEKNLLLFCVHEHHEIINLFWILVHPKKENKIILFGFWFLFERKTSPKIQLDMINNCFVQIQIWNNSYENELNVIQIRTKF